MFASIAQWIERCPPEAETAVQVRLGAFDASCILEKNMIK